MQVRSLFNQYKHLDESVLSAGEAFLKGESSLDVFSKTTEKAKTTTFKFGATLKSVAANIGIMLAVSLAIKAVTAAWDKFDTTVSEAEEDLKNTQSVISDLKTQIKDLESIDANALTQGQKDKLQNLKEQLEVQEQLEEIEKRRLAREMIGNGNWVDFFDNGSYANASYSINSNLQEHRKHVNGGAYDSYKSSKSNIERIQELIKQAKEQGHSEAYIERLEQDLLVAENTSQNKANKVFTMYDDLLVQKSEILSWRAKIQQAIDDGSLVGSDLTTANTKLSELESQLNYVNSELAYMTNLLYGGDDSWENTLLEKTKYSLQNLLDNGFTEDELKILATLTFDKNSSLLELRTLLDEQQQVVDDFIDETTVLNTSDILSPIQALTEGLEQLDSVYADVLDSITEDGKDFDWSSILNNDSFKKAFNVDGLTDEYNNFIETIANSPTDIEACQGAFNSLATAYVYNSDALKNVTEETKSATVAMLEQMGVSNALEVVEASLADKAFDMAEAERIATLHSIDLTNVTYDEINALLEEEAVSEFTAQKLAYYALQKQLANDEVISTSGDCQNIINLAKTAGYTTSALVRLAEIKKAFENDSIVAETMRNNID